MPQYNDILTQIWKPLREELHQDDISRISKDAFRGIYEDTFQEMGKDKEIVNTFYQSEEQKSMFAEMRQLIDETENKIITPALEIFNKRWKEKPTAEWKSQSGLQMAKYYLQLGTNMQKILALVEKITMGKTDFEEIEMVMQIWAENFGHVYTLEMIEKALKDGKKQGIFKMSKRKGGMRFIISSSRTAYEETLTESLIDTTLSAHYEQFKLYTENHYMGFTLTGEKLYQILGKSDVFKGSRDEFWTWWAEEKAQNGKKSKKQRGSGFKKFLQAEKLDDFIRILEAKFTNNTQLGPCINEFLDYAKEFDRSSNSKNINYGHVAEAYENHLEEHHGFNPHSYKGFQIELTEKGYPDKEDDTDIRYWAAHLAKASGRWPGYFGPDTTYAQIKQIRNYGGAEIEIRRSHFYGARRELAALMMIIQKSTPTDNVSLSNFVEKLKEQYGQDSDSYRKIEKAIVHNSTKVIQNEIKKMHPDF